jgi:hypothetical protein
MVEDRDAGLWLRDRFGPGTTVMSRVPEIAYYAQARWVALPYADPAGVIAAARRAGARILVLDEPTLRRRRPDLLAPPAAAGLTLVRETDEFPDRPVRVFAVDRS